MGDKPTKVDGSSAGGSGIGIKYGGDYDARGIIFGSEPKYYGEGPCDEFFLYPDLFLPCPKHIFPFHPCPKYIFPLPPLFCDEPPQKIQYFKVKSEREAANERVAGFINDRAGKEIIPLSDVDSIEVSKGRVNDGELKIRVVTRSLFDDVPKVRLFIVKADGTIYEEVMEEIWV